MDNRARIMRAECHPPVQPAVFDPMNAANLNRGEMTTRHARRERRRERCIRKQR